MQILQYVHCFLLHLSPYTDSTCFHGRALPKTDLPAFCPVGSNLRHIIHTTVFLAYFLNSEEIKAGL
jgi:hypothetical protein